ncbi:MAG: RNA methyltransferase [Planctomycetaceae bacterium]|nr:RNA methyltransferase [Planctomycetaceae bacterium]
MVNNLAGFLPYLQGFLTPQRQERFESVLEHRTRHLCVVLENLTKPHNTSAVLRSCDCFGVQNVHMVERDCDSKVDKQISLGSHKWLTTQIWNTEQASAENQVNIDEDPTVICLSTLKSQGYCIVAATPHETQKSLYDLSIDTPIALLFGSEKKGISAPALELADECITVPMYGFTESFNLSVCAALCLSELVRQLHNSDMDWHLSESEKDELRLQWAKRTIPNIEAIERRFYSTGFAE